SRGGCGSSAWPIGSRTFTKPCKERPRPSRVMRPSGNQRRKMPKPRRVLFAGLFHETHTFVEPTTGLADFTILRGQEMLSSAGDTSPLGGALQAAQTLGWEILPTADFRASPGGLVEDEVVETFWREFLVRAQPFLASGVDGIYIFLPGSIV